MIQLNFFSARRNCPLRIKTVGFHKGRRDNNAVASLQENISVMHPEKVVSKLCLSSAVIEMQGRSLIVNLVLPYFYPMIRSRCTIRFVLPRARPAVKVTAFIEQEIRYSNIGNIFYIKTT